jgi:predicted nucleic acid-binding protein
VRLVLDTSVVVAALRSRLRASNRGLRKVAQREAVFLLSPALLLEYEKVLKRPEHRLVHGLTEESVDAFISELAALAEPVEMHFQLATSEC